MTRRVLSLVLLLSSGVAFAQFGGERMLVGDASESIHELASIMEAYNKGRNLTQYQRNLDSFYREDMDTRTTVLYDMALAKVNRERPEAQFQALWRAVEGSDELDPADPLRGLANAALGVFLIDMESHSLAITHLKQALPYLHQDRLPSWEHVTYNTWVRMIVTMEQMNQMDSALLYENKLLGFAKDHFPADLLASCMVRKGKRMLRENKGKEALTIFDQATSLLDPTSENYQKSRIILMRNGADAHFSMGQIDPGTELYLNALEERLQHSELGSAILPERIWISLLTHLLEAGYDGTAIRVYENYRHHWPDSSITTKSLLEILPLDIRILQLKNRTEQARRSEQLYTKLDLERSKKEITLLRSRSGLNNYIQAQIELYEQELINRENREQNLRMQLKLRALLILLFGTLTIGMVLFFLHYRRTREASQRHAIERKEYQANLLRLENKNLQYQNQLKEKAIDRIVADNQLRTRVRNQIARRIENILQLPPSRIKKELNILRVELMQSLRHQKKSDLLQGDVAKLGHLFEKKLRSKANGLTQFEVELCGLLRLGLTNAEIQNILGKSNASIRTARYRIRKKIQAEDPKELMDILRDI